MRRRLIMLALVWTAAPCPACDVPVYRYALEHWNPDAYQVVIVHQGPMGAADQRLLAALGAAHANLTTRAVDSDRPLPEGPQMVVRLPGEDSALVWDGPLNADAAAAVTDSPCRRRIADRLLAGDAAVWVLLQSGRREADDAAADHIQRELDRPTLSPSPLVGEGRGGGAVVPDSLSPPPPPSPTRGEGERIADGQPPLPCSLVCVSRADPAERLLVETLLSTEPDLRGRDEPMAFPVFGRGRVLYALVGAGVNAANVRHTLDFLVGGCSCTIKRQNPGVDLLLNADWSVIAPTTPEETPQPTAPADDVVPLTPLPRTPARPAAVPAAAAPAAGPNLWLVGGAGLAAVLVVVSGWLALRSKKPQTKKPSFPDPF